MLSRYAKSIGKNTAKLTFGDMLNYIDWLSKQPKLFGGKLRGHIRLKKRRVKDAR